MRKPFVLSLAAALLLGGCSGLPTPGARPQVETITPAPSANPGIVTAEASIEPARWSELRSEAPGRVAEVSVEEGATVEVDDLLARLDSASEILALREAEFALASGQAELALLKAGPRAEEVAVAGAAIEEAEAGLERAVAQLSELTGGATAADIAAAQVELTAAEGEWLRARDDRDELFRDTEDDDEEDLKERDQANYRFAAAIEALEAARARLAARKSTADERVREAEARVASASAQRDVAAAELAQLEAGAVAWQIAAAEAVVERAAVGVSMAQAALARTEFRAPFAGTVTRVDIEAGSRVDPGQVVAVLATVDHLEAHTIDLTELDVARVREGQAVFVTADALPEARLQGRVARIGLRSVDYRGDVTYPVVVELDDTAPGLRWGMTALVEVEAP